jgi:hypothetical protein
MPIGYRMGKIAMDKLGLEKVKDHGAFALSEMGVGHPQTCMMDGIQAITGCTFGKLMMERLNYGKVAMILYAPGKGAIRVSALPEFQDDLGKKEFFAYRKKGIEPSQIPPSVVEEAVKVVLETPRRRCLKWKTWKVLPSVGPSLPSIKANAALAGNTSSNGTLKYWMANRPVFPARKRSPGQEHEEAVARGILVSSARRGHAAPSMDSTLKG